MSANKASNNPGLSKLAARSGSSSYLTGSPATSIPASAEAVKLEENRSGPGRLQNAKPEASRQIKIQPVKPAPNNKTPRGQIRGKANSADVTSDQSASSWPREKGPAGAKSARRNIRRRAANSRAPGRRSRALGFLKARRSIPAGLLEIEKLERASGGGATRIKIKSQRNPLIGRACRKIVNRVALAVGGPLSFSPSSWDSLKGGRWRGRAPT